jgi:hypothetical protein
MKLRHAFLIVLITAILTASTVRGDLHQSTQYPWNYNHVSAFTTTQVKTVSGTLHSIVVNAPGQNPCTVVIYDSSSGATGTQIGAVDCSVAHQFFYDVGLVNGLALLTVTTSSQPNPQAADVTVTYQ